MLDQVRQWLDGIAQAFLIRFDQMVPDPPGMGLCDAVGAGMTEAGVLGLVVPWSALVVCMTMFIGTQVVAMQLRILRVKASYVTGGGGAA